MANRRDYFLAQLVSEAELDAGFNGLELADWAQFADLAFKGIVSGAAVAQHSPTPDLTVDVAIGVVYDKNGKRMSVPSLQVVNLGVDSNSVSTAVVNVGQSKIVSLFLRFKRTESDQRTDGNAATVFFVQDEGFEFFIEQGAESVTPSPVALRNDSILLADVTRTFGQTQIVTGNLGTTRRETMFKLVAGALTVTEGTPTASMQAILTHLNNHITSVANLHPATAIDYAGGAAWLDGTTNPAATAEVQFDKLINDLINQTASNSGAHKMGSGARTNWLGGRTNPAGTIFAAIDKIITDLAATTASDDGAERIGAQANGNLGVGSVRSQLDALDTAKGGLALANAWTQNNTFSGSLIQSGVIGKHRRRVGTVTDASGGVNAQDNDVWKVANVLTANRTRNLNNPTGTNTDGQVCHFVRSNPDPDYTFEFLRHDGVSLFTFPILVGSWASVVLIADVWQLLAWGGGTTINEAAG
jgi:hypothetical protein